MKLGQRLRTATSAYAHALEGDVARPNVKPILAPLLGLLKRIQTEPPQPSDARVVSNHVASILAIEKNAFGVHRRVQSLYGAILREMATLTANQTPASVDELRAATARLAVSQNGIMAYRFADEPLFQRIRERTTVEDQQTIARMEDALREYADGGATGSSATRPNVQVNVGKEPAGLNHGTARVLACVLAPLRDAMECELEAMAREAAAKQT